MSDEDKRSQPYNLNHYNMGSKGYPFSCITDQDFNPFMYNHQQDQNPSGFDPSDHMSFTGYFHEYNTESAAFDLSCSTSDTGVNNCNNSSSNNLGETCSSAAENPPTTPSSSMSFLSSEAGVEEEEKDLQQKEDGDVKSKQV